MSDKHLNAESAEKAAKDVSNTIKDIDLSGETASKTSTNLNETTNYSDEVSVGWSDTVPASASASQAYGGGYIKLDESFFNGEAVVTLPSDRKFYGVDENGKLKVDENGNAIEATWNEQSLHNLRKGFVDSVSTAPTSLVYSAGEYGFGYFSRITALNVTLAAGTRFTNWLQKSNYITCDATFINPNDPLAIMVGATDKDNSSGRFTMKNVKLNVLSFEPYYPDITHGNPDNTTTTNLQVSDTVLYQIGSDNSENTLGRLNIGFDFESIARTEAWDVFLNEVAGNRNTINRSSMGINPASRHDGVMKLELYIHKTGYGLSFLPHYTRAISPPTFSFFVVLLPRDNMRLEYDASSPYVARNYSFKIVEPPSDDFEFSYSNNNKANTTATAPYDFKFSGSMDKDEKVRTYLKFSASSPIFSSADPEYKDDADICIRFKLDNVKLLANDTKSVLDSKDTTGKTYSLGLDLHGQELSDKIAEIIKNINDGLANNRKEDKDSSGKVNFEFDDTIFPVLSIKRNYGYNTVETSNYFDFTSKYDNTHFLGIKLLKNSHRTITKNNSLTGQSIASWDVNDVELALYFSVGTDVDETAGDLPDYWQSIPNALNTN